MRLESTQASINQSGDGRPRAMLADTMKIPDPIIDPDTNMVASVSDIALTNSLSDSGPTCGVASVVMAELLMQNPEKARSAPPASAVGEKFSGESWEK